MKYLSVLILGCMAASSPQLSWALSESDFYCLPAPFGLPSVFSKVAKSCDASGRSSTAEENICSEGARCMVISDAVKKLNLSRSAQDSWYRRLYHEDYAKAQAVNMLPGMGDRWLVSNLMCPRDPDTGLCPLPQDCKGDIYYGPHVSDYAHPDVDSKVRDATVGTGNPEQHHGAGSPISP
jgi:hypothetical protein